MGRCYEFGVAIGDGCEHAMVVSDEGGSCGCAECGATCGGRFRSCAQVTSTPGYVPLAAPAWAHPGGTGAMPVRDHLPAAGATRRAPAESERDRFRRDDDLAARLDRVSSALDEALAELRSLREANADLLAAVAALAARMPAEPRLVVEHRVEIEAPEPAAAQPLRPHLYEVGGVFVDGQ